MWLRYKFQRREELGTSERGSETRSDWRLSQEGFNCCSVSIWGFLLISGRGRRCSVRRLQNGQQLRRALFYFFSGLKQSEKCPAPSRMAKKFNSGKGKWITEKSKEHEFPREWKALISKPFHVCVWTGRHWCCSYMQVIFLCVCNLDISSLDVLNLSA